jgi:hypothetical protein
MNQTSTSESLFELSVPRESLFSSSVYNKELNTRDEEATNTREAYIASTDRPVTAVPSL